MREILERRTTETSSAEWIESLLQSYARPQTLRSPRERYNGRNVIIPNRPTHRLYAVTGNARYWPWWTNERHSHLNITVVLVKNLRFNRVQRIHRSRWIFSSALMSPKLFCISDLQLCRRIKHHVRTLKSYSFRCVRITVVLFDFRGPESVTFWKGSAVDIWNVVIVRREFVKIIYIFIDSFIFNSISWKPGNYKLKK